MGKLLLAAALSLATVMAYGQGQMNFANATSAWSTVNSAPDYRLRFDATASLFDDRLVPGSLVCSNSGGMDLSTLRAVLLYGASTITRLDQLSEAPAYPSGSSTYATFRGTTSVNAGSWFGGNREFGGAGGTFYPGDTVSVGIVVWDTRYAATGLKAFEGDGTTYQGLLGYSSVFQYTVPTGMTSPTDFLPEFTPFTVGFPAAALTVPEPGTLALGGLGAAALLLRRRRNS